MKKSILLSVLVAALIFVSCNKEKVTANNNGTEAKADTVIVNVAATITVSAGSRREDVTVTTAPMIYLNSYCFITYDIYDSTTYKMTDHTSGNLPSSGVFSNEHLDFLVKPNIRNIIIDSVVYKPQASDPKGIYIFKY